jgi:hypothetical protein
LSKRDIEDLLDSYDDNPVGALATALEKLVGTHDLAWDSLVAYVPEEVARPDRLLSQEIAALDAVVKHLVENRRLEQ